MTATDTALALAAFGLGSMLAAMLLLKLLEKYADRSVMLLACGVLSTCTLALGWLEPNYLTLLNVWFVLGLAYGVAMTPSGRLLRRSADSAERPALFAANFSLSHACWLIAYLLAGWFGANWGMNVAAFTLAALCFVSLAIAAWVWPSTSETSFIHSHEDLPAEHPHLKEHLVNGEHKHSAMADELHIWPTR